MQSVVFTYEDESFKQYFVPEIEVKKLCDKLRSFCEGFGPDTYAPVRITFESVEGFEWVSTEGLRYVHVKKPKETLSPEEAWQAFTTSGLDLAQWLGQHGRLMIEDAIRDYFLARLGEALLSVRFVKQDEPATKDAAPAEPEAPTAEKMKVIAATAHEHATCKNCHRPIIKLFDEDWHHTDAACNPTTVRCYPASILGPDKEYVAEPRQD